MEDLICYFLNLLSQFAGGRGEMGNELVRFGLGMFFWGILFVAARMRSRGGTAQREKLLAWGFAVGFLREGLMFLVFSLALLGYFCPVRLHAFYPPAEHALLLVSVLVVAAAFLQFILDNRLLASRYLKISLVSVVAVYLVTFPWWAHFSIQHPTTKFGQVWCDWIFHIVACVLIGYALYRILKKPGWISKVVSLALLLFFLDDSIKLIDMALHEHYEDVLAPIRHFLHLLAILFLGYVYWHEQLLDRRRLERRILEISDLEKRQLGRDLHDGLIQQLTGINFFTELLAKKIENGELPEHRECQEVKNHLNDAITQARAISSGLYPVELGRSGLRTAIEELVRSTSQLYGISCKFHCNTEINRYNIETATHIYRIVQESISNAARHSGATQITVVTGDQNRYVIFEIRDNGKGFDVGKIREGMGIQTMRYRASLIQGHLTIEATAEGACVRLFCPAEKYNNQCPG